jgi:hypothetical protein
MSAQPLNFYDVNAFTSTVGGAEVAQVGATHIVEYRFDLAGTKPAASVSGAVITIPSGAIIRSGSLIAEGTLSGGTNITLGTAQTDGSVIDANGLLEANTGTTGVIAFDGALLGTQLALDSQLTIASSRNVGIVKVVIVYDLF